jgi:hypothetical protein
MAPRRPADRHTPLRHTARADARDRASARPHIAAATALRAHEHAATAQARQVAIALASSEAAPRRMRSRC